MSPAELLLVVVWSFAVSFAGGTVGLVLGNLRLPVIVLVGSSAAAAAGANVAISGAAALTAAYAHWRGGRLDWRLFAWMAPTSLIGAVIGGLLAGIMPERLLLFAIGLIVLYGAYEVARHRRAPAEKAQTPSRSALIFNAALIGFGVGVLGGFVGLILGSLRLPALVKYVGITPGAAVGTNAAVGVLVGVGGLVGHLPSGIDWQLLFVGAAAMPAAYLGARFTGRLSDRRLLQAMAAVLLLSGLAMLAQAVLG